LWNADLKRRCQVSGVRCQQAGEIIIRHREKALFGFRIVDLKAISPNSESRIKKFIADPRALDCNSDGFGRLDFVI
jgi:hypothetical protein